VKSVRQWVVRRRLEVHIRVGVVGSRRRSRRTVPIDPLHKTLGLNDGARLASGANWMLSCPARWLPFTNGRVESAAAAVRKWVVKGTGSSGRFQPLTRDSQPAGRSHLEFLTDRSATIGPAWVRFPSPAPSSGNGRQRTATLAGINLRPFGKILEESADWWRQSLPAVAADCPSNHTQHHARHSAKNLRAIRDRQSAGEGGSRYLRC